ncbi:DUF3472 domain-containing protein [Niabella yanshanensis]|uniref:DUF3472 domain-containing protein n=1 Tax=Niabella yanshanensis TaxID=577386 RepID=A0ABZ0W3E7_9BACT|nr:DUF3472 domain-containing protein [Niabella yanshanensis]WQD37793.1 DUF3472 domain-containing protein [Niabella yanshanensis]
MIKLLSFCCLSFLISVVHSQPVLLPIGGNAWTLDNSNSLRIRNNGITRWQEDNAGFAAYIRVTRPGLVKVGLETDKLSSASQLWVSISGDTKTITVNDKDTVHWAGEWVLKDSGYVAILVRGLKKTGTEYPVVRALKLEGTAITNQASYTKNNDGNFFHWGRRGPSVHMNYQLPKGVDAEWFYNEVTVPKGNDVLGSYFMANGFGEGYFGMQVNGPLERRILFSVWSPFHTDDPKAIPEDQKIKMLKKGDDVYTGEFGNEGSGGQSFLKYNWKAEDTQKFLLHVRPDGASHTIYTAYFFDQEKNNWRLVASFRRPKLATYLKRPHSFLENFNPDMGNIERKVFFGNQWVLDTNGEWHELTKATFTADNTARIGYRKDYSGGANDQRFFLRNCGFFNDYTPYNQVFERKPTGKKPQVNLEQLP